MNILVAIIAIAAVVLLITGGLAPTLNFLIWVGIALAVIAVIIFLVRYIGGGKRSVDVELQQLRFAPGDRLLLCSDGLTGTMKDEESAGILGQRGSAADSCRRLVDLALERGAPDNVTVIVARYEASQTP